MRKTADIDRATGSFHEAMRRRAQIVGTSRDEFLFINDLWRADTAEGGAGDDVILGDRAPDHRSPLFGIDVVSDGQWKLHVTHDTVRRFAWKPYDKVFRGGAGDDWLASGAGRDVVHGGDGNDVIYGEGGADELHGGDGDDIVSGDNLSDVTYAFGALDRHGDDVIDGGSGNDVLFGNLGNDRLIGGSGNDVLHGDDPAAAWRGGDDDLDGGDGDDCLFGGAGDDLLNGGNGDDVLVGGPGRDTLIGGDGDDCLFAYALDPDSTARCVPAAILASKLMVGLFFGQSETGVEHMKSVLDRIEWLGPTPEGRHVVNQLFGGKGNDLLVSGKGHDWLEGGDGDDRLSGGAGDDVLDGGDGDDRLSGGAGNDVLDGGSGNDTYDIVLGGGADTIIEAAGPGGGKDRVQFGKGIVVAQLQARMSGQDLVIQLNANDSVTIRDWFQDPKGRVEQLLFWDGTSVDVALLLPTAPSAPLAV